MQAAVLNGPFDLQVVEKPKPGLCAGEVLVRVNYCGICGSDLHAYKSGLFPFGMTIGHEYSGIIEEVDPAAGELKGGEKVTGIPSLACGSCFSCRAGKDNICENMTVVGVSREGAMAEAVVVPAESIALMPAAMPLELGTLVEPCSVALHAAKMVELLPEQKVVILGAGAIGLSLLLELKRRGLESIVVADINSGRARKALDLGAWNVIDLGEEKLERRIDELTGGAGADVVFECVGIPDTIKDSVNLVRQGGTVMVLGICEIPVELFFLGLVTREIQLKTAYGCTKEEFREALEVIAANPDPYKALVGKTIPLEKVAEKGFVPLLESGSAAIRTLVKIN